MDAIVSHNDTLAEDANATGGQIVVFMAWLYPLFIVVYLSVTIILGRKLTAVMAFPMRDLSKTAERIATGDIDVDLNYESKDEIGTLTRQFRAMVEGMKEQAEALSIIAGGDYSGGIHVRSDKDVVNKAISAILDNNNSMITEIRSASDQVSSGAQQIAQAAQNLASGSSEQAS
ncbi:MAG: HAMP domain-containing protein, partial [Oscillospiraceae bacterium]|nr:HAMP domain-containing protein [Oscillospiraceae bacterium]